MCPKPVAELALVSAKMGARFSVPNMQSFEGDLSRSLRRPPCLFDGGFKTIPKLGAEWGHFRSAPE